VESERVENERAPGERVGIGRLARDSGLTVSALRFYDGAGVLVPDWVDPCTGYRWYAPEQLADARLLARLRRVGMPVRDIATVLRHRADAERVDDLLREHVRRLEDGLASARRELSTIRSLLGSPEGHMTATHVRLDAAELAAALRAVRFAVGHDPELPMLGGVLLDVGSDDAPTLRLAATDRYRLALAAPSVDQVTGPPVSVIAPAAFATEALALVAGSRGPVVVEVDGDNLAARTDSGRVEARRLDHDFPDYRRLVELETTRHIALDTDAFRDSLRASTGRPMTREGDGVDYDLVLLGVDAAGALMVGSEGEVTIGVNREFLLDAVDAVAGEQLVLELGGPISPLAVRDLDDSGTFSILMPARVA